MVPEDTPYKLFIIPSWYPPRGGAFFREHSRALADAGLRVHVLAAIETGIRDRPWTYLKPGKQACLRAEGRMTEHRRIARRIPLSPQISQRSWVNTVLSLYEEDSRKYGHPDLVQAHSSMWGGLAAAMIREKHGTPYVVTEHRGRFTGQAGSGHLVLPWHLPLLQKAFSKAAHIVTVSRAVGRGIVDLYPAASGKMSVIPNMTDTSFFGLPADAATGYKKGETGTPFRFICVASLEELKGVQILTEALAILRSRGYGGSSLLIAGDGPLRGELERRCREKSLPVRFAGQLDREALRQRLHESDALILPSLFEAFGIVLIEAMACGLPVVATRSGGPGEIVQADSGLLTPPGDATAMADAMEQMIKEHSGFDRTKIAEKAKEKYSPHVISAQYVRLYQKLLR